MSEPNAAKSFHFSDIKGLIACGAGAVITLLIFHFLPYSSNFVEQWFSNKLFVLYRTIWDHTVSQLPVAIIYLLILGVLYYIFKSYHRKSGWKNILWTSGLIFGKLIFVAIILFYWLWGFNYKRKDVGELLQMNRVQPSEEFIFEEYCLITDALLETRKSLDPELIHSYEVNNDSIRKDLQRIFSYAQLNNSGKVRVRKVYPKGALLRFSTAGIYLPFVGEGHIDAGLHPITHPFTMMHEMSHGYGWTGEDDCNFFALLGCVNSKDPFTRYSGYFGYWRYLRSQAYRLDKDRFNLYYRDLPEMLATDYREVLEYQDRYPDILPRIRDLIYDNYLKSHGIPEGLVSYSQMIVLSYRWQELNGSLLLDGIPES